MSDKRYPTRMHEVLGVEEKETAIFKTPGLVDREFMLRNDVPHIRFVGDEHWKEMDGASLMRIVNHPERITRRPRLTEEQEAQLKALNTLGFKWLAKQRKGCVMFFQKKPHKNAIWFSGTGDGQEDYGVVLPNDTHLSSLVSWSDPAPLDIVQTLRDAGVEIEKDK